ncbi:phage tail protein [Achromobacter xylosoxidans]
MTTIQTAAQIAAETAALKQQTTEINRNCTALKARGSELAKTATAGAKNTAVTKLGTAEKAKATQALDRNARAIRSEAVEQTLADMRKTGALLGVDSEVGRMRVETEIGRFSGESDDDKVSLLAGASRLDKLRAQMKMSAYIQSLANPDAAANEEKRQKQEALDQALSDGTLSQDKYDTARRGLGLVKRDGDFMLDVNDKLLESARNGASKIQDILGTKMYDFVADKFDKLGLSFLNNVAKMVTSAASAKLMETLLGNSFMEGKGGVGGWIGKAGSFLSDLFSGGGGISVGSSFVSGGTALSFFPSAKGNAFTNGMVTSPVAFPMGVMGEAGPEAIMPLHRGADGSLGIRAAFPNVGGDTNPVAGGRCRQRLRAGRQRQCLQRIRGGRLAAVRPADRRIRHATGRSPHVAIVSPGRPGVASQQQPFSGGMSMAIEVFNWSPRINPQGRTKFRILTAQFGDGYSQRAADGINNKVASWPLQFSGSAAQIGPIVTFLDRHEGHRGFQWQPPLGEPGFYTATEYDLTALGGEMYSLAVTFQQVFRS